jgi:hypothetical protein
LALPTVKCPNSADAHWELAFCLKKGRHCSGAVVMPIDEINRRESVRLIEVESITFKFAFLLYCNTGIFILALIYLIFA